MVEDNIKTKEDLQRAFDKLVKEYNDAKDYLNIADDKFLNQGLNDMMDGLLQNNGGGIPGISTSPNSYPSVMGRGIKQAADIFGDTAKSYAKAQSGYYKGVMEKFPDKIRALIKKHPDLWEELKRDKLIKQLKERGFGRENPFEPPTDNLPTNKATDMDLDPNTNKLAGQNFYDHPDVNYDPTQRVYNSDGQILKPASTQGNQPPAASKPFGRQPIYQSPNNAAIATTLGSVGGAGATVAGVLYHEAAAGAAKVTLTTTAEIYQGSATGYAASVQGASAWSTAANAVSSAWSAATTAIGNAVAWVASAVSSVVSAIAGAIATAATAVAAAAATAAAAVGSAIASAIAWIAALAFPW